MPLVPRRNAGNQSTSIGSKTTPSQRAARVGSLFRLAKALLGVVVLAACGADVPSSSEPAPLAFSRGPVPDSARLPDGEIDLSQVPDFIPALDGDRQAGWIRAADVLPPQGQARAEIIPVYGDDLVTVIGRMYPDAGFVPLAEEDEVLAERAKNREVTIRIRNNSAVAAILEIIEEPDESNGPQLIAPPIVVEAGADQDVVLRAPRDRWALRVRNGLGYIYSNDLARRSTEPGAAVVISAGELSWQAATE